MFLLLLLVHVAFRHFWRFRVMKFYKMTRTERKYLSFGIAFSVYTISRSPTVVVYETRETRNSRGTKILWFNFFFFVHSYVSDNFYSFGILPQCRNIEIQSIYFLALFFLIIFQILLAHSTRNRIKNEIDNQYGAFAGHCLCGRRTKIHAKIRQCEYWNGVEQRSSAIELHRLFVR